MTFRVTQSNAFSRPTKAMQSILLEARDFSCSCLTTKIASVVPLPGMKPNWESSIDTNCLRKPSTILSRTYMTYSVSLGRRHCPFPMHPPFPCRGRQCNSSPSQRVPCHREWLQLRGHGSWRRPCHRLLVSSPPLFLMGPAFARLDLWDSLLNYINGNWAGRAFHCPVEVNSFILE